MMLSSLILIPFLLSSTLAWKDEKHQCYDDEVKSFSVCTPFYASPTDVATNAFGIKIFRCTGDLADETEPPVGYYTFICSNSPASFPTNQTLGRTDSNATALLGPAMCTELWKIDGCLIERIGTYTVDARGGYHPINNDAFWKTKSVNMKKQHKKGGRKCHVKADEIKALIETNTFGADSLIAEKYTFVLDECVKSPVWW